MKYGLWIIVVAAVILTTLSAGCRNSTTQTTSETLPILPGFNGVNTGVSKSANGLSLSLSLDAKTYKPGDTINIVVSEWNTLSKTNNVLVSDRWPLSGLIINPCGTQGFSFGMAVFQGYYIPFADASIEVPLILFDPGVTWTCPVILPANATAYEFKPLSDIATRLSSYHPGASFTSEMKYVTTLKGYWTDGTDSQFTYFSSGVYTVVAGDEWGTLVVLHFTVTE